MGANFIQMQGLTYGVETSSPKMVQSFWQKRDAGDLESDPIAVGEARAQVNAHGNGSVLFQLEESGGTVVYEKNFARTLNSFGSRSIEIVMQPSDYLPGPPPEGLFSVVDVGVQHIVNYIASPAKGRYTCRWTLNGVFSSVGVVSTAYQDTDRDDTWIIQGEYIGKGQLILEMPMEEIVKNAATV